jgi:hypothetical protein
VRLQAATACSSRKNDSDRISPGVVRLEKRSDRGEEAVDPRGGFDAARRRDRDIPAAALRGCTSRRSRAIIGPPDFVVATDGRRPANSPLLVRSSTLRFFASVR